MKIIIVILILIFSSCGSKSSTHREKKPFVKDTTLTKKDTPKQVSQLITTGTIKENWHFKECKYPEIVKMILEAKRQHDMEQAKLPREYYSEWFFSLYDAAHTDPAITEYLDKSIQNTISYMAKTVEFNYTSIATQDSTVKIFLRK